MIMQPPTGICCCTCASWNASLMVRPSWLTSTHPAFGCGAVMPAKRGGFHHVAAIITGCTCCKDGTTQHATERMSVSAHLLSCLQPSQLAGCIAGRVLRQPSSIPRSVIDTS